MLVHEVELIKTYEPEATNEDIQAIIRAELTRYLEEIAPDDGAALDFLRHTLK